MLDKEILELSYKYILEMANSKRFNIQTIAISKFFSASENYPVVEKYMLPYQDFCEVFPQIVTKDFVYKKDYYTTREMYIICPAHYLYYTFNVFRYLFCNYGRMDIDFSLSHVRIFYSGFLSFEEGMNIAENCDYVASYSRFQDAKNEFIGKKVLTIDVQDFFKNIHSNKIVEKLLSNNKNFECKKNIENLKLFFEMNNFYSLPQLHYSVASSILSQIYLADFSRNINDIFIKENCEAIRYVDDFYISLPKYKRTKRVNEILNKMTYYLWKDNLNLNSSKTKLLSIKEYQKEIEVLEDSHSDFRKVSIGTEKLIGDKVESLLLDDAKLLITFFNKLKQLRSKKGIDLKEYHELINKYISIDGDHATKVINSLIFGQKWKKLNVETKKKLVSDNSYIFFNPSQFTSFFLMVCNNLKIQKKGGVEVVNELVDDLKSRPEFTFRDSIITIQYFLQHKLVDEMLIEKMIDVNKSYINYLELYID